MKAVPAFVVSFALLGPLVSAAAASAVPNDASQVKPLQPGLQAPAFVARRPDGQAFNFDSRRLEKPVVMIFYRGGWCPYCNAHLGQLGEAEPELVRMGYEVLFLSADKPELLYPSLKDPSIKYTILSDAAMDAARAFGIAFRVDDATVAQYRQYGIDLEAASGRTHHELPVPAVFVIDRRGVIRFTYANPDYKTRLEGDKIVAAARSALQPD